MQEREGQAGVDKIRAQGVTVCLYNVDICDRDALHGALKATRDEMPPIRGVFQCAASLADRPFETMTFEEWQKSCRAKAIGSWNLFQCLAQDDLSFFIFLSSSAGIIGNRGQANYAAGNSFQDALARHIDNGSGRTHGISLDFGLVLGTGTAASDPILLAKMKKDVEHAIVRNERSRDFADNKEGNNTKATPLRNAPSRIVIGVGTGGLEYQNKPYDPYWTRTPLFSVLNTVDMPPGKMLYPPGARSNAQAASPAYSKGNPSSSSSSSSMHSVRGLLSSCECAEDRCRTVCYGLRRLLARVMDLPGPEEVDSGRCFRDYGVDSLSAVAIRNWVDEECGGKLDIFEILGDSTIRELSDTVANKGL
ncbi:KR domain-domain-containing protein [Microdochium bolleyi]|uniref:KR domain-domain-containing protein n=1 Tax=Microdochium bolleyi TaxID=196109 RepID=A0A136JA70_9PEZI|nr:KR domain-domain-containing protein [Microdochium bolleyi]